MPDQIGVPQLDRRLERGVWVAISGTNVTLLGKGEERDRDAGTWWVGRRGGSRVGLTGLGGVGALRAGLWIRARGSGSSWGTSPGPQVGEKGLGDAGLGVEVEELIALLDWGSRYTLQLATRVLGKLDLPVNCRFAYTSNR